MKNKLAQFIKSKYGFEPEPTQETLRRLGLTRHRFNSIMDNKYGDRAPFTAEELIRFMLWLDMPIQDSIKSLVDYENIINSYRKAGHQLTIED